MVLILLALTCGVDLPLNDKVVEFAYSKLGQQVGNGQCSSLAAEALAHAGIRWRGGSHGKWGIEIKSWRDVQPGDILQFENVVFVSTQFREDGAFVTQQREFPHHTAVVSRVKKRGKKPVLAILHQNVNGTQIVQEWTINMAELRRGSIKIYRPTANDSISPSWEPSKK